jgi:apoptosis-stimulating of p53 protein 1
VQEKLGILNQGVVYGVYDYEAHNSDELGFSDGDQMVVLRKGDELEREWWWSRLNNKEGYVPRNLLGVRNIHYKFQFNFASSISILL